MLRVKLISSKYKLGQIIKMRLGWGGGGGGGWRAVNRGTQIRRSVLLFGSNPSIRRYFRSISNPHSLTTFCGTIFLQQSVDVCF